MLILAEPPCAQGSPESRAGPLRSAFLASPDRHSHGPGAGSSGHGGVSVQPVRLEWLLGMDLCPWAQLSFGDTLWRTPWVSGSGEEVLGV